MSYPEPESTEPVEVPSLIGYTLEEAQQAAALHGFIAREYVPPPPTRWQRFVGWLRSTLRR